MLWLVIAALGAANAAGIANEVAVSDVTRQAVASRQSTGTGDAVARGERRRLLADFDFNERPLGNYEPLPMRWTRHLDWGFPHYLVAEFDEATGHDAPPSFRLELNGGSVGFRFRSRSIEVIPANDYAVFGWIRTEGLRRARASLSAGFMDRTGALIPGTEVFSRAVGGNPDAAEWSRVEVHLRGGIRNARFIALSVWLTQPGAIGGARRGTPSSAADVEDIHGRAWFDDIRVYRLPHSTLETGVPGNVFAPGHTPSLIVRVSDPDGDGLSSRLVVWNANGDPVLDRDIPVEAGAGPDAARVEVPDCGPGLYHAELSVSAASGLLGLRKLRYVSLAPLPGADAADPRPSRGFGVIVNELDEKSLSDQFALIRQLGPEWVKLPVWLLGSLRSTGGAGRLPAIEAHLSKLVTGGHEPVGWIGPDQLGPADRRILGSLVDLLSGTPTAWQPRLAFVWSRYAGLVNWWQVGDEQDAELTWDPRLPAAVTAVAKAMREVVTNPVLVMPCPILRDGDAPETQPVAAPLGARVLSVPYTIPGERFHEYWSAAGSDAPPALWVTVETPPEEHYAREMRIRDLTKRLILAKANGAAAVFLRQPWTMTGANDLEPNEDYVVFRTVAAKLAGTRGFGTLMIDGRIECHVLDRGGRAVMAVWDDYAPPGGRDRWLPLDPGATQTDPLGRVTVLHGTGMETRVCIGPMPTFVEPLPTWLVRLRQGFALGPPHVEARLAEHERVVRFANPFNEPISGDVRLVAPPGWEVRPLQFRFALAAQQTHEERILVSFPTNESAGTKVIVSEFAIDADRLYRLRIPAWLELGLEGIDVQTFTRRADDRVLVRQSVTNRTDSAVSFYGSLSVAQRERLTRLIPNLQPGQTATREYMLDEASRLAGSRMRLSLHEVDGSRIWNCVLDVP